MSKPFESTVHAVAVGCQINNLFLFDGYIGIWYNKFVLVGQTSK